jgi:hypothetical protein
MDSPFDEVSHSAFRFRLLFTCLWLSCGIDVQSRFCFFYSVTDRNGKNNNRVDKLMLTFAELLRATW